MLSEQEDTLNCVKQIENAVEAVEKDVNTMEQELSELIAKGPTALLDYLEDALGKMASAFEANQQNIIKETNMLRERVCEIEEGLQAMLQDLTRFADEMNLELPSIADVAGEVAEASSEDRLISLKTSSGEIPVDNIVNEPQ